MEQQIVRSSCRGCHGVCQVMVHLEDGRVTKITGDPSSPTSRGYLCPKGAAAPDLLYHPDRVLYPLERVGERGENKWKRISWDEAIDRMVEKFSRVKAESGAEYLAVAQGTGRPYTEFTGRFAHAFGTPNFVSPGHVCYLPRVIASSITMGGLPVCDIYGFGGTYPEAIMIWGCNITESGAADGMCGGMLARAIKNARKVIVVDPRRIKPAESADHWLQLRPGSEGALALAMINVIIAEDLVDHEFIERYTHGFRRLATHVSGFTPEWAEPITGIDAQKIRAASRDYASASSACLQWGNGVDMSVCSFQTARSLLILRAITGNIDRPGGDVFWVPPQGLRSKSPLTNPEQTGAQFLTDEQRARMIGAGRFPFGPGTHPPTFWNSVVTGDPYRVRALWIIGSNPLLTQTSSLLIERALKDHMEFTVVSDFFLTPTAQLADLVLPAATWLEQDDVVNFHKIWCVLARKKVAQQGEARDDRDVILELARRLNLREAFPWRNWKAYLGWLLENTGLSFEEFCDKSILLGNMRYRKYETEGFRTPTGKIELYSTIMESRGAFPLPVYRESPLSVSIDTGLAEKYPLIMMSGTKIRHFFHSELRQMESLRRANPDPVVELHPQTAEARGVRDGDWVWVESPTARVRMRAKLFDGIAPGVVNAQHAWWFPEEDPPEHGWKRSSVNLLFGNSVFDPESGSEPLKSYLCEISRID